MVPVVRQLHRRARHPPDRLPARLDRLVVDGLLTRIEHQQRLVRHTYRLRETGEIVTPAVVDEATGLPLAVRTVRTARNASAR